jgi:hypothetical protein
MITESPSETGFFKCAYGHVFPLNMQDFEKNLKKVRLRLDKD